VVVVFLCGDVMTGRGIDQILPRPGDPALWEPGMRDARQYVRLAEAASGPVPRPVDVAWPWGEALAVLDRVRPEVRVVNLETSITARGTPAAGKGVHYRMHPANTAVVAAARPSACTLANNHVLDFGPDGLADTLAALAGVGIPVAGAGPDADAARRPVAVPLRCGGRVLVFAAAAEDSGTPPEWAATDRRPGVYLLPDLSTGTAADLAGRVRSAKRPGDLAVLTVHWGTNWGYEVPAEHVSFAHHLVEHGVDLVHGHSAHHPRPIEIYRDRLILYGCGDFIDDYEGIPGYEEYRDDLRLMYLPELDPASGRLVRLAVVPLRADRMRLTRASTSDTQYLGDLLDRISRPFHAGVTRTEDQTLEAVPRRST
jgi:poly-gamma-glutamate capsule biosynthesis protein CapA/YwtB (metallophosphatase superfamily)